MDDILTYRKFVPPLIWTRLLTPGLTWCSAFPSRKINATTWQNYSYVMYEFSNSVIVVNCFWKLSLFLQLASTPVPEMVSQHAVEGFDWLAPFRITKVTCESGLIDAHHGPTNEHSCGWMGAHQCSHGYKYGRKSSRKSRGCYSTTWKLKMNLDYT